MLYPAWRGALMQARQETNQQTLLELVSEAELAIYRRLQQLVGSPYGYREKQDLQAACDELLRIRTERLGWPSLPGQRQEARTGVRQEVRTDGEARCQN
jgi:hypothetical protein